MIENNIKIVENGWKSIKNSIEWHGIEKCGGRTAPVHPLSFPRYHNPYPKPFITFISKNEFKISFENRKMN